MGLTPARFSRCKIVSLACAVVLGLALAGALEKAFFRWLSTADGGRRPAETHIPKTGWVEDQGRANGVDPSSLGADAADAGSPPRGPGEAAGLLPPVSPPIRDAIAALSVDTTRTVPPRDLFADCEIPVVRIEIPADGMNALRRNPRRYVRATLREGTTVYADVAIRLKGGPGSFRQVDDRPSFTLNFDKFKEGQKFHGLKKIHLNSSVQDGSYLSEKICRELFDAAGVPTPQAGHAIVDFGGERHLYVLVEGVNKQFLKRYFQDPTGNVYDGHSGLDVSTRMPTNSGDDPHDHSGLRALAAAVRQSDSRERLATLERALDLDRFLSFVAMETLVWHWDGYTMNRNNFRIFHDRGKGRMVFLPHGLDQVLRDVHGAVFPDAEGMVARCVLEMPETRQRYRERVTQLLTNVFRMDAITGRIREVSQRVQAALETIDSSQAGEQRRKARTLIRLFQQRAANLRQQLLPETPIHFDDSHEVLLTNWISRIDLGDASLDSSAAAEVPSTLHITTSSGCTASWRTTAVLENGKYRLEARLRTEGVVFPDNDPRAGAGLRISRYRVGQKNAGDSDWKPVAFDFEVSKGPSAIELVCELRAVRGEVWFDLESLHLSRRPSEE